MNEERLEELRQGKCGEAFKAWCESIWPSGPPPDTDWFEERCKTWRTWTISWDAAMREVAEEAAAILMAADQEDAPTLDWGVCRAGLRKLAEHGKEKN